MAKTYNENITRNTDWSGDASTNGLPVSGEKVQKFIKDELNSKVGSFYKEEGGTMVYCFANEDDKASYLESGDESLILDSFETVSKYKVLINTDTLQRSHNVIYGTTGNSVSFQFKITDESDMITDSKATIEYSFLAAGNVNKYTVETQMNSEGWTTVASDNIDSYLREGENTITITITGLSSKASSQFIITYNLFDLSYTTSFKYNEAQTGNSISVPYIIECSETKYLEFYIDGYEVSSQESSVITDIRKDSQATLLINNLANGVHTLQTRAYVKANDGTKFYTPIHFYSFAKSGSGTPAFLMDMILDSSQSLALSGSNLTLNVDQFDQINFDWSIYDYNNRKLNVVFDYIESAKTTTISKSTIDKNGDVNTFTYRPMTEGQNNTIKVYALGESSAELFSYVIKMNVDETSSGIKEATDGLILKLQSLGRRNEDVDKDVWSCVGSDGNTYEANFSGFSWSSQQGWDEDTESLVISNGATVEFNIYPMLNHWETTGGTIEIDLETFDIEDDDAVICECKNDIVGVASARFKITATNAEFATADGVKINTRYKDNERLKIAFIGNRIGTHEDGNLIYLVVNGVLERAALYTDNDKIYSSAPLRIGDPTGKCKVRLRSIRYYNRALSVDEAFNNYVVDSEDVQEIYEKNNIYKAGTSSEVGFDEVANKIPVMIFTGDMNKLVSEGQSTKTSGVWYPFDVEYINRQEPERNFVAFNAGMKLQGTSSLGYPRKNFKLKTKGDKALTTEEAFAASKYEIDPDSPVGNKRLRNKYTGEVLEFGDINNTCYMFGVNTADTTSYKVLKNGKYRFRTDCVKSNKWTLKADFMESSCSHNVGAGRSWNDIFENTELKTDGYTNNTYKNEALIYTNKVHDYTKDGVSYHILEKDDSILNQKAFVCRTDAQKICHAVEGADDIRTAIDGFPMVCFYRTSHTANDLVFMGQYNFINDKGAYEVFGFEDIEDPDNEDRMIYDASQVECWEGLKNANPISLFQTIDNWDDETIGWKSTFASRYPDEDDYGKAGERWYNAESGSPIYELCKWISSTRHVSGETTYSGTIDINADFAKTINGYQYGYSDSNKETFAYAEGTAVEDNAENRQKKFETEKWEHFDVWKLAGYYIYLMRYGAVDQFVKNTMLFTDGNGRYDSRTDNKYRKWFYINYDNDCLFGLRNNGELAFDWKLDRQTTDGAADIIVDDQAEDEGNVNTYAMMGHDSTLWNNLEADAEFMRMVRDLDNSMTSNGLNYDNMVKQFDTDQTEKWCERIYNANERYKYIDAAKGLGDMSGQSVDNLWMLQGTRRSHRHWWIANHFDLLDAKWLSGGYRNNNVRMKTDCFSGDTIHASAGTDYYYAWGTDKGIYESNMVRSKGEAIDFTFPANQVQGDPLVIYAVNKMSCLDFSDIAYKVAQGSFEFKIANNEVSNTLKKLVIGNSNVVNTAAIATTTWSQLRNLEYLDITNYSGIVNVPLSSFANIKVYKAKGSSIGDFSPANGSSFELADLPDTISTIVMNDIKFDNFNDNFKYTPSTNLRTLELSSNEKIDSKYYNKIIKPWIQAIENSTQSAEIYKEAKMDVSNIDWAFGDLNNIRIFKHFKQYAKSGNFTMRGRIDLSALGNLSMDNINEIKEIFGENCFNELTASIYIITPNSIFLQTDANEMVAGQSNTFTREIYPDESALRAMGDITSIEYLLVEETDLTPQDNEDVMSDSISGKRFLPASGISSIRSGLTLTNTKDANNKEIGVLSCIEKQEGEDNEVTVLVKMKLISEGNSNNKISFEKFTIKDPTYATKMTIDGPNSTYKGKTYTYTINDLTDDNKAPIGTHTTAWSLSGSGLQYVSNSAVTDNDVLTLTINNQPEIAEDITISAVYTNHDGSVISASTYILVLNENVIMTSISNPIVMERCYNAGFTSSSTAMLKSEAIGVTNDMLGTAFSGLSSCTFYEFAYFTGLTKLSASAFADSQIEAIALPDTLTELGGYAFANCSALSVVSVVDEDDNYVRTLPSSISAISEGCFFNCSALNNLALPDSVTEIKNYAFGNTSFKETLLDGNEGGNGKLILSSGLTSIERYAFETEKWTPSTTVSKIETFSIPSTLIMNGYDPLFTKGLKTIIVESGHNSYIVDEGILYNKMKTTLIRYPSKKDYVETYTTNSGLGTISSYAFVFVSYLDNVICNANQAYALQDGHQFENSKIKSIDLRGCDNLMAIEDSTFKGCSLLEEVLLPNGQLQSIGTNAFNGCTSLASITLPSTITELKQNSSGYSYTFCECPFTELVLPDSILSLGMNVADGCPNLQSVTFPAYWSGLTTSRYLGLSDYSIINNCQSLSSVTLPLFSYTNTESANTVVNTGIFFKDGGILGLGYQRDGILSNCSSFSEYILNENDNNNVAKVIDGCLYLMDGNSLILREVPCKKTDVAVANGTIRNHPGAFMNCPNLTGITFPSSLTQIGHMGACAVKELSIPSGVTSVDNYIFESCSNLESVSFYGNITGMGDYYIFENCTSLKSLCFYGGLSYFPSNCLRNVPNLEKIVILSQTAPSVGSTIPFGEGWNYAGNAAESRTLYVPYGHSGYDSGLWNDILLNSSEADFTLEEFPLSGEVIFTIYSGGTLLTDGTVYAKTSDAQYSYGEYPAAATYDGVKGGWPFILSNNVSDHESIEVYSDSEFTDLIGSTTLLFNTKNYQISEPIMSTSYSAPKLFSTGVFGSSTSEENNLSESEEMAEITKSEYEALMAKVNRLTQIIDLLM